ncbi:cyclophilin-like fold protein [Brachybacterium saurashtrense]|uniref:Cyclophilin-like domain-containing protein n=1 Tax=Brachybacterium saurashtrense TaxID=556288 RepID=A0A345YP49_9MICO|nr:cyclophilin-like fold protein [Brachybacterium saurashtrense]AXK45701.1 hypothetical protein DWV08_08835 [Brachybacterium saurashtrense]RRR24719.1 hypothetical protein DXU92_00580 [Brachybacterium saurashtrense]
MDIRLTSEVATLHGTLGDGAAARDLAAMLPLTLTLADFHATEMIADLPGRLRTDDSPAAAAARAGDIAYYAPWGNLALFLRDFPRSSGLVILGRFDGPADALTGLDGRTVTLAAVEQGG